MNRIVTILMVLVLPFALFAQNTITGNVTDADNGNALAGANVVVGGTTMGAAADADGYYVIENVPDGTYTLTASVIGYENGNATITLPGTGSADFALDASVEITAKLFNSVWPTWFVASMMILSFRPAPNRLTMSSTAAPGTAITTTSPNARVSATVASAASPFIPSSSARYLG